MAENVIVNIISRADKSGFTKTTRALGSIAAKATAITAAVSVAGGAVGALGVGLAGVGALATPALAAVVLGMDGIKKAAEGAKPAADQLKKAVSSTFESGMKKGFADLAAVMGAITPAMQGVASATSGVFNGLAATIRSNIPALNQLIKGGQQFITAMGPGLNQLVAGFIGFGAQAQASAAKVGAAFGGLLGRIGQAFNQLPVTAIMGTFAAALDGLGNLIAPLIALFGQLAAAMGPSLGGIFTGLGQAVTALTGPLTQIARDAGPALAQTFTALAPALGSTGQAFATIVSAVAPFLPVVASLVSALATGLGPALPVIVGAIVAYNVAIKAATVATTVWSAITKAAAVASKVWAAAQWLLNSALLANPLTWIVVAIVAVIAVIVLIATKTTWFQTIWQAMCAGAKAAWQFVVDAVKMGIAVLQVIWGAIVAYFTMQWQMIQAVASAVWSAIVAVVQAGIAVIQAVWSAMAAVWSAVWSGIQAVASAVMNGISAVVSGVINTIVGVFQRVQSVGSSVFGAIAGAARAFGSAVSSIIGFVQSLISAIASIRFPSPPSWLTSIFGADATAGMPGLGAFMVPPEALRMDRLHLAQGYPSLSGLGALGARGGVTIYQDNSSTVKVDGSGIADPQAVAGSVDYALNRNGRTRGAQYAVKL